MIPDKIAPELLAMRKARSKMRKNTFARRYGQCGVISDQSAKPVRVIVLIECAEEADFTHLAASGIRINQETGSIRTAFLPLRRLGRLSDEPAIYHIYSSETLDTAMDLAAQHVALPLFQTTTKLTGGGVILGLVDTGFAPRHPALRGRILRAWDQLSHGDGVSEGKYGIELVGQRIEQELDDPRGHGTHVAGIAAGGGAKFRGVAPGADLVLVRSDLNDAHVMDGLQYIFRVATELGRPAVINLSLASLPGPYDGSDPLCKRIDGLSGPGRIICCAAGNRGEQHIHAQVNLVQGQTVVVSFGLSSGLREVQVRGAYRRANRLTVAMQLPDGTTSGLVNSSQAGRQELMLGASLEFSELSSGSEWGKLTMTLPGSALKKAREWRLLLSGDEVVDRRVDLWLRGLREDGQPIGKDDLWFISHVDDTLKIGTPGAAASAITVASLTTRNEWRNRFGEKQTTNAPLHDISPFSSAGPLLNGGQKPDIAAPGAWIVSAQADGVQVGREAQIDQAHSVRDGTSMAAAFISGLVALLLEHDPTLTPAQVKKLLQSSSHTPSLPVGLFDVRWGYGLPDAAQLMQRLISG